MAPGVDSPSQGQVFSHPTACILYWSLNEAVQRVETQEGKWYPHSFLSSDHFTSSDQLHCMMGSQLWSGGRPTLFSLLAPWEDWKEVWKAAPGQPTAAMWARTEQTAES